MQPGNRAIYTWHIGLIAQTVIQTTAQLLTCGNEQGKGGNGVEKNQIKVAKLDEISYLMLAEYLGTNWFHKL